jgi:hypothetical protein
VKAHEYVLDPADSWHEVTGEPEYPHNGYDVRTFARDLVERRNGTTVATWRAGAYQVRGGGRTKTFKGEVAWSAAAREHSDRVFAQHRKELHR